MPSNQSHGRKVVMKKRKQALALAKLDLVQEYADYYGVTKAEALEAVEGTLNSIRSLFARVAIEFDPDLVQLTLANFGRFDMKKVEAHEKFLNHLERSVTIPEGRKISFTKSAAWESILSK